MKSRLNIMELFELRQEKEGYKFVLYHALPTGHLEKEIDYVEYDRLYNKYNHFLVDDRNDVKVFAEDFNDTSNMLFYLRKKFAEEFAPCFS